MLLKHELAAEAWHHFNPGSSSCALPHAVLSAAPEMGLIRQSGRSSRRECRDLGAENLGVSIREVLSSILGPIGIFVERAWDRASMQAKIGELI